MFLLSVGEPSTDTMTELFSANWSPSAAVDSVAAKLHLSPVSSPESAHKYRVAALPAAPSTLRSEAKMDPLALDATVVNDPAPLDVTAPAFHTPAVIVPTLLVVPVSATDEDELIDPVTPSVPTIEDAVGVNVAAIEPAP
jgi:hypothetical protein